MSTVQYQILQFLKYATTNTSQCCTIKSTSLQMYIPHPLVINKAIIVVEQTLAP